MSEILCKRRANEAEICELNGIFCLSTRFEEQEICSTCLRVSVCVLCAVIHLVCAIRNVTVL